MTIKPQDLEIIQRELQKRYADDYEVTAESSPTAALARLDGWRAFGGQVIVLLVAQSMAEITGIDLLAQAHELHPQASGCC